MLNVDDEIAPVECAVNFSVSMPTSLSIIKIHLDMVSPETLCTLLNATERASDSLRAGKSRVASKYASNALTGQIPVFGKATIFTDLLPFSSLRFVSGECYRFLGKVNALPRYPR